MGKQKFKLSHIIPNAWFYKLKYNISHAPTKPHKPPLCFTTTSPPPHPPPTTTDQPRQSYHFTRDLPLDNPPLLSPRNSKSKKPTTHRKTSFDPTKEVSTHRKTAIPRDGFIDKGGHFDIIINFDECKFNLGSSSNSSLTQIVDTPNKFQFQLPRITTNTRKITKEDSLGPTSTSRRFSVSSPGGVRLKVNSPKVMGRKQGQNGNCGGRKSGNTKKKRSCSMWESLAVVKISNDPERDFRESMVEMIVQNNIRASKDLEDLLACYLSLNSDEYHDVIIEVFKQIWVDLSELRHYHYHKLVS